MKLVSLFSKISFAICILANTSYGFLTDDEKPNIIFIMADDMGYGDAGCFGGTQIQTSNIDQISAEGIRFTDCYAGSTVCAPSRSVLMTGLHAGHTRVRGNTGKGGVVGLGGRPGRIPLRDEDITVAEVLKTAGYTTGMTGKWGLGEPNTNGIPNKQGFDQWFGFLNQRQAHNHYPDFIWLNKSKFPLVGNENSGQQIYSHDLFTGFALNFIRENKDKPFFLYVPYCVPHSQFETPDLGAYAEKPWSDQEKTYAAMITRMDNHIGQILKTLVELEIDKNTIVFFCSDNGAANRYEGTLDSSGQLRGRKRDMFEGGLRTPMVVRWPGKIAPGSVSETAWTFADFLATAAELGSATAPSTDGVSIVPTLLGQSQDLSHRFLYWEFFEKGFQQAVRWKNWKAIRLKPEQPIQLFDLTTDLGETTDVASKNSEVVSKIENFLKTARTDSEEFPIKPSTNKDNDWVTLFDGKSFDGWEAIEFGGEGDITIGDGMLTLEAGDPFTGFSSEKTDLPKTNYEISLQARKTEGVDFFCGLTFPVAESHCTLIVGGWAGATVGLSCIDEKDASRNETTKIMGFKKDQWYKIKVRVQPERIKTWIDGKIVIDTNIKGKKISLRGDTTLCSPLGLCTFMTQADFKDIKVRKLTTVDPDAPAEKAKDQQ